VDCIKKCSFFSVEDVNQSTSSEIFHPHESVTIKQEFLVDVKGQTIKVPFTGQACESYVAIIRHEFPENEVHDTNTVPFTGQAHTASSSGLSLGDDIMMGNLFESNSILVHTVIPKLALFRKNQPSGSGY
jgi:hypothetical protein